MITVVTGASGHVGNNLSRSLLADGQQVRVLIHNNSHPLEGLEVEGIQGDVCDPESVDTHGQSPWHFYSSSFA